MERNEKPDPSQFPLAALRWEVQQFRRVPQVAAVERWLNRVVDWLAGKARG